MARDPAWLLEHKRDVYSQTGEDGIIEAILSTIGDRDRWCVEFGAWDGQNLSNTRNLIEAQAYSAVLIEGDALRYAALKKFYEGDNRIFPVNAFVGFNEAHGLDALLRKTPIPEDFDFLSIDIDGNDYHVWNAVRLYRPKVVVIEFNPTIPTECHFIQPADPALNQGASLSALTALALSKGYQLASVLLFNAFFVRDDLFPRLEIAENSAFVLRKDLSLLTFLFHGYDGTMFLQGSRWMPWHALDIGEDDVQVLPAPLRRFPSNYTSAQARLYRWFRKWRAFKRTVRAAAKPVGARFAQLRAGKWRAGGGGE